MALKPKKIKNLMKEIPKIVRRDITELNTLSDEDLLSLWTFFKFLITDIKDKSVIFLTKRGSIIANHREILMEKYKIRIELMEEFMAS